MSDLLIFFVGMKLRYSMQDSLLKCFRQQRFRKKLNVHRAQELPITSHDYSYQGSSFQHKAFVVFLAYQ